MNGGGEMIGNGAIERRASAEHKVNLVNSLTTFLVFFGTMNISFTDQVSFPFKLHLSTGTPFRKL